MRAVKPSLILFFSLVLPATYMRFPEAAAAAPPLSNEEFKGKLVELLQNTEKSIKVIREQIVQSQNAPFLPDLYLQLADLLSQKATSLYYIQLEREGKDNAAASAAKDSPVVQAQKEAIEAYRTILKDFPTYAKRSETMYKLALSLKAIDESTEFVRVSSQLVKEFPQGQDSVKARLLLGQYYFEKQDYDPAIVQLQEVAQTHFPYERNLARYRIGLIQIAKEKFALALGQFEAVVNDPELKEQENPFDVGPAGKTKGPKNDLKREALVDSIRAYTHVYDKNPDPVAYYSKLCPTEAHFQEIIEKLALRYVYLKKFDVSVKLLRTATERMSDPQKVVAIYREALLMIPIRERLSIPPEEMDNLLQRFNLWMSFYDISPKDLALANNFFEKQIRDLATSGHDFAKTEPDPAKKKFYLERSRDYYLLYIGFFPPSANSAKMALNLADVFFLIKDFTNSGDYYLRVFQGEFGTVTNRKALIENAILCLQKDPTGTFYDRVRTKGLLIKAIQSYFRLDPKLKSDPKLALLLVKAQYEQGFFPESLDALYGFIKRFRNAHQALDAADLILDYFNTRNDFSGLEFWADRLLSLKLSNTAFNAKVAQIKKLAKAHVIQEKVRSVAGYDEFSQGKSYLSAALNASDPALRNAALQEALAKSKRERDIQTYLGAAGELADREKDHAKRSDILRSIALENMKIGRYYTGLAALRRITSAADLDAKTRADALEQVINTGVLLRDSQLLEEAIRNPQWNLVPEATRARVRDQVNDMLESPIPVSPGLVSAAMNLGMTDELVLALYKGQNKLDDGARRRVQSEIRARCTSARPLVVCRWVDLEQLDAGKPVLLRFLASAPAQLTSVESSATRFMVIAGKYRALEGSEDPQLEVALSLRGQELYGAFSAYLRRVATANPEVRSEVMAKANESLASVLTYRDRCQLISQKAPGLNPAQRFCQSPAVAFKDLLSWPAMHVENPARADVGSAAIDLLQKSVFSTTTDPDPLLKLAMAFYTQGMYRHATAFSTYGIGAFKERENDFKAILGCSVLSLGFVNEASYHLKGATDYLGMKTRCSALLHRLGST